MKACSGKWAVCFCGSLWAWSAWWPQWQTCSPRCFGEPIAENCCYFVSALSVSFSASSLSQRWKFLVSSTRYHVCNLNLACALSKIKTISPLHFTVSLLILWEALYSFPATQFAHPEIMNMTSQERKCIQMCLSGPPGKFQLRCCFRTVLNMLNEMKAGHLLSNDKIIWSVITWGWSHVTCFTHHSVYWNLVGQESSKKLASTGERMMWSREEGGREQPRNKWCKTPALWLEPVFHGQAHCDLRETCFFFLQIQAFQVRIVTNIHTFVSSDKSHMDDLLYLQCLEVIFTFTS